MSLTHSRPLLLPQAGLLTQCSTSPPGRLMFPQQAGPSSGSFQNSSEPPSGLPANAACLHRALLWVPHGVRDVLLGPRSLPLCLRPPQSESYTHGENFSKNGLPAPRLILKETRVCCEPWGVCRLVGRLVCKGALAAEGGAPGPAGHGVGHSHRSLGLTLLACKAGFFGVFLAAWWLVGS